MRERPAKRVGAKNPPEGEELRFLFIWEAGSELQLQSNDQAIFVAARSAIVALRPLQKRLRDKIGSFLLRVPFGPDSEKTSEEELIASVKRVLKAWVTNTAILRSAEEPVLIDFTEFLKSRREMAGSSRAWQTQDMGERKSTRERSGRESIIDRGIREGTFTGEARLEHLQAENKRLRRERNHARVNLSKELSDFALLREASRVLDVDLKSIQEAIKTGRLPTYKLAGGRIVIRISEGRTLWEEGGYEEPGRPAKRVR